MVYHVIDDFKIMSTFFYKSNLFVLFYDILSME